jgi:hypothetical protein
MDSICSVIKTVSTVYRVQCFGWVLKHSHSYEKLVLIVFTDRSIRDTSSVLGALRRFHETIAVEKRYMLHITVYLLARMRVCMWVWVHWSRHALS